MEKKTKVLTKWLYWFTFAVAIIIAYKTITSIEQIASWFGNLIKILLPFGIGILISYILYIPCKKIETTYKKTKKIKFIAKKARPLSIITVYVIVLILIVILINFIMPLIVNSVIDLVNNFQSYYETATAKINELPDNSILKSQVAKKIMETIKNVDITQIIHVNQITQYAQGAISFASGLFDIFVTIVVSIYVLNSRGQIITFLRRVANAIFNKKTYNNLDKYFNRSNEIFFKFLTSQVIDAIIVGIITTIAMSIMGVKYAVLLGFMIGLFNLIPYVGAIIAVAIAGIITLLTGGWQQAIIMLVIIIILQQIDANIINPKIIGNSLEINPLLVILAVTVGGAYFGIIGMFLAVPIIAVAKLIIEDLLERTEQKKEEAEID